VKLDNAAVNNTATTADAGKTISAVRILSLSNSRSLTWSWTPGRPSIREPPWFTFQIAWRPRSMLWLTFDFVFIKNEVYWYCVSQDSWRPNETCSWNRTGWALPAIFFFFCSWRGLALLQAFMHTVAMLNSSRHWPSEVSNMLSTWPTSTWVCHSRPLTP